MLIKIFTETSEDTHSKTNRIGIITKIEKRIDLLFLRRYLGVKRNIKRIYPIRSKKLDI